MKRLIYMGIITLILSLLIIFYKPNDKYLGVFENKITIENDIEKDDYEWTYEINNNNLVLDSEGKSKLSSKNIKRFWTFVPIKDGETTISFYYSKQDEEYTTKITYKFKIKKNKIIWIEGEATGTYDFPNPF